MIRREDWYINEKGYPRFHRGPLRGRYVHRVVAEQMLGRPLNRDEQVHHCDFDKMNFAESNLEIIGQQEHGWVSAAQAFWMKVLDVRDKKEWDEYFDEHSMTPPIAVGAPA